MKITEFIETHMNRNGEFQNKIDNLYADPYEVIKNADDLPYDKIGLDEFGKPTKLVELSDGRDISVIDLLGYSADDPEFLVDLELKEVYDSYMSLVKAEDINFTNIKKLAEEYKARSAKRKELVNVSNLL